MYNIYKISNDNILIHGRTSYSGSGALPLFWTGSGIEAAVRGGSAAFVEVESDYAQYCQWITVELNGAFVARMPVPKGRARLCLYCGREDTETVSHVRLFKDVQPMPNDEAACLLIHSFETDGELVPPPARKLKLEFIGDSITSGEGVYGAQGEGDWIPMWFSGTLTYPNLVSKALDADFRIISQSGWGLVTGWNNDPLSTIPSIFDKVCGAATGERNEALGADNDWDFSQWQPDAVIVNLGTNDSFAAKNEPFVLPDGTIIRQRDTADGLSLISEAAACFIRHLRRVYPSACILWVTGLLETRVTGAIASAVDRVRLSGDSLVRLLSVEPASDDEFGSRWHPGVQAHRRTAGAITRVLRDMLGGKIV